jgi:hypothetical protein
MAVATDRDLYARGIATLLSAWEAIARGTRAAAVVRLPGAAAAVMPEGPEREVYNNAVPDRGLAAPAAARAVDAVERAYRRAGIDRFAVWAHEGDGCLQAELGRRGAGWRSTSTTSRRPASPAGCCAASTRRPSTS